VESEEVCSLQEQVLECGGMGWRGMESGEGDCSRERNGVWRRKCWSVEEEDGYTRLHLIFLV